MKKNLILALALATAAAAADTETVTYNNLLDSSAGWTFAEGRTGRGVITIADGSATAANNNWAQATATYTLGQSISLTSPEDTFSFSFDLQTNGSVNACLTLSLIGSTGTTTVGMAGYNDGAGLVQYGHSTDTTVRGYGFSEYNAGWDNSDLVSNLDASGSLGTAEATGTFTINATVAWDGDSFVMDFGNGQTLDLGTSFEVSSLVILADGPNDTTVPSVTNLSLTATTALLPEPTTATLSLLALAGLAVRRRRK